MKKKWSSEDIVNMISDIVTIGLGGMVFTFLFGYLINALLFSCLMPFLIEQNAAMKEYFLHLPIEETMTFYNITYEICVFLGFVPAFMLIMRMPRNRREQFVKDTDGLWTAKDGFRYHLKHHGIVDTLIAGMFIIVFFIVSFMPNATSPFSILYRLCGKTLGLLFSIVIFFAIQLLSIVPTQNRWSAQYYVDDI